MQLSASNLKVGYPGNELFAGVSFMVRAGDRIGVVGDNGCGKSSFFSALLGSEALLDGVVSTKKGLRIAHLKQTLSASLQKSIWEFVCEAKENIFILDKQIQELSQKLEKSTDSAILHRLSQMREDFELMGGYQVDAEIRSILAHLDFPEQSWDLPLSRFSGGQIARVQLAKVLLSNFDLLLLDEPTNHLDFTMISWLERYLLNLRKPYLIISHNRSFLDKVTTKLFHLYQKKLTIFHGDFAHFQKEFALLCQRQEKAYNLQKKKIDKTKDFIARNMAGQKTKQAASRLKALEKLELLDSPTQEKFFSIRFNDSHRTGQKVLECQDVAVGYGKEVLAKKINLLLCYGDRIALIGKNGCGKSTFLSTLCGLLPALAGEVKHGSKLKIGYFDQKHILLEEEQSVLQAIWSMLPGEPIGKPLSYLASYGFAGEMVDRQVSMLSGGEKSRLYLARLILQNPNFLILDEPTNHLDLKTILVLEKALLDYKGSLLFVCHDKYFVERIASKFWIFEDGCIKQRFDCDYGESKPLELVKKKKDLKKKEAKRVNPHKLKLLEKEISDLESELGMLEKNLEDNYKLLSDKNIYQEKDKLIKINDEILKQNCQIEKLKQLLEEKEEEYLQLC